MSNTGLIYNSWLGILTVERNSIYSTTVLTSNCSILGVFGIAAVQIYIFQAFSTAFDWLSESKMNFHIYDIKIMLTENVFSLKSPDSNLI